MTPLTNEQQLAFGREKVEMALTTLPEAIQAQVLSALASWDPSRSESLWDAVFNLSYQPAEARGPLISKSLYPLFFREIRHSLNIDPEVFVSFLNRLGEVKEIEVNSDKQ